MNLPGCSTMQDASRIESSLLEMAAMDAFLKDAILISSSMEDETRIATLWSPSIGAVPLRLNRVSDWDNLIMTATIPGRRPFGLSAPARAGLPAICDLTPCDMAEWLVSSTEIVRRSVPREPSACPRDEDGYMVIADLVELAMYAQGLDAGAMITIRSDGTDAPTAVWLDMEDGTNWKPTRHFAQRMEALGRGSLELEVWGFDDPVKASMRAILTSENGLHVGIHRPETIAIDIDHDVSAMDLLRDMDRIGARGPWFERVEP
jgi:hypothetical protein